MSKTINYKNSHDKIIQTSPSKRLECSPLNLEEKIFHEEPKENFLNFENEHEKINTIKFQGSSSVETNDDKYFLMFDSLKVDSDHHLDNECTILGNSKTSTSSAVSDNNSNVISDENEPMVKDFINKKRKRRINKKCK